MTNYDVVELKVPLARERDVHTKLPEGYRPFGAPINEDGFHFPVYLFHRTLTDIERSKLVQGLDLMGGEVVSIKDIRAILDSMGSPSEISQSAHIDAQASSWGTMASPALRLG